MVRSSSAETMKPGDPRLVNMTTASSAREGGFGTAAADAAPFPQEPMIRPTTRTVAEPRHLNRIPTPLRLRGGEAGWAVARERPEISYELRVGTPARAATAGRTVVTPQGPERSCPVRLLEVNDDRLLG